MDSRECRSGASLSQPRVRRGTTRRALPQGGVFALGSRAASSRGPARGDVGQNGYGGHAHNDISSFELSLAANC